MLLVIGLRPALFMSSALLTDESITDAVLLVIGLTPALFTSTALLTDESISIWQLLLVGRLLVLLGGL